jgi:hypothetical protein
MVRPATCLGLKWSRNTWISHSVKGWAAKMIAGARRFHQLHPPTTIRPTTLAAGTTAMT